MNLFQLNDNWEVAIDPTAYLLKPFKKILDRDKTKTKTRAMSELALVWYVADLSSDYQNTLEERERINEVISELTFPAKWKIDAVVLDAIKFYKVRSATVASRLYASALKAVSAVNDVFDSSEELLDKSTDKLATAEKILKATERVDKVMEKLKNAETTVLSERKEDVGRSIGSQQLNMFEND